MRAETMLQHYVCIMDGTRQRSPSWYDLSSSTWAHSKGKARVNQEWERKTEEGGGGAGD